MPFCRCPKRLAATSACRRGADPSHLLGRQVLQEVCHVLLPEYGAQMGEMPVGLLAARDQHVFGVGNALDLSRRGREFGRISLVVAGIDCHQPRLDLMEMWGRVVVHYSLD